MELLISLALTEVNTSHLNDDFCETKLYGNEGVRGWLV